MQAFIEQVGVDWRLLASQAVNFGLLLIILRVFAYKPLLKILHERRAKIEEGLMKAKEAEVRLAEIDEIGKGRIREAEKEAMWLLRQTEEKAKTVESGLLEEAKRKEAAALAETGKRIEAEREKARQALAEEAVRLVKQAIIKTVELEPEKVDEALIRKAVANAHRK